jgi:hypothetical protein
MNFKVLARELEKEGGESTEERTFNNRYDGYKVERCGGGTKK